MTSQLDITFARSARPAGGHAIVLAAQGAKLGESASAVDPAGVLARAVKIAEFKGAAFSSLDVIAPAESPADRLTVVGIGDPQAFDETSYARLGGAVLAQIRKSSKATVYLDAPGLDLTGAQAAEVALGMHLRAYSFDSYKTKKTDNGKDDGPRKIKVTILTPAAAQARKSLDDVDALVGGVALARDLVNEPANVLGPVEFAAKAKELDKLGVKVEILTEKEMRKLGMGALLGVAQGSTRPPRLAVMQWNGGKARRKPVAFVGKGVVFDSGGVSIKPASGMEDMKGDMAGAAAVVGLMHALAVRKAKANVVGIIGLVENMVDGNAQRPGDIVTSMSGQTVEVLNTDAEGRLVLGDALWYCNDRFEPEFMVDLATLTGAIMIALGQHYAGLFSNDDTLSERLLEAGVATGERLWRMPMGPEFDKMIDSKTADMKNIGGRYGSSITAAQFLKRFVKDTPWAHLDIAGTALGAPSTDVNHSWGTGFGVRLLNRLVRDHYEG